MEMNSIDGIAFADTCKTMPSLTISTPITTSSLNLEKTSTTSTTSTTSATTPVSTSCVGHYWPVENKAVEDVIGHQSATSNGSPQFTRDRFGVVDGALRIYSSSTAWRLPHGRYIKGDTTITMWVKDIECGGYHPNPKDSLAIAPYGIFNKIVLS
jgi:hypothetical protein